MMKKTKPFHDAVKSLRHCEICLDEIQQENTSALAYEFFYNSFIFYINQSWELAVQAFQMPPIPVLGQELIDNVNTMRNRDDPLLQYVREARNQLAHRENILWISDEENQKPEGLGSVVNLSAGYYKVGSNRYSCAALPSLVLNFVGSQVAAKPITTRNQKKIAVPQNNAGQEIENSPLGLMEASYKSYGKKIERLLQLRD